MAEKLLINVAYEETRVALVESGKIQNLEIDTSRVDNNKGNIYKGVVHRVNPSLQAAFVDYGAEKQGFLPLSEIHSRYYPKALKGKKATIQDVLIQGQELMVQVVKDEIGNKGASLTTFISLPGRYIVLMADSDKTGISRRVESDERQRLKGAIDELPVPDGFGLIVRTAGVGREKDELAQDLEYLSRLWSNLQESFRKLRGAGIIHQERHIALRFIRDYAHAGIDEIIVDNKDVYDEIVDFCTALAPELKSKVRHYSDSRPLYSRYQIEDQIDDIFARRIDLPSGGSIVIDQAEALVAIDVNSGRVKTDDIEQTALTTNLEAAAEVARQLKIRDRGGLVVVDFIDMRSKENIRKVEAAVKDAFASDKAKVKYSKISEFGLMEISRQRLQSSIMTGSFTPCLHCGGTGRVRSVESSALYLLRRLKETVIRGNYMHAEARMTTDIANYLVNRKRRELMELEAETETTIEVHAEEHTPPMVAYVELLSQPSGKSRRPRRVLQTIDLVRSDVEKRELDDDEDYLLDITERRTGWTPPGNERSELEVRNRELEAEMAVEKERVQAQREADESRRRQLEIEAQTRLTEAQTALLKERERLAREQMGLWGRIKAFFVSQPPLDGQNDPLPGSDGAETADESEPRKGRRGAKDEARRGQRTRSSGDRGRREEHGREGEQAEER
ncbi:MAG: Rne/Rng family ribonuclease, partial [Deltaproteobacteria bacterium]